ncbi:MAG: hypothetical protein IKD77_02970 [Bacilli bacterium]|nr:hypothetical protein [Bacilli bacterium]
MIYFSIFIFKIIEDALATLRLIVVSNGKKALGAFLQFICTIIWVLLTGSVLVNFTSDYFKIIAFALGSFIGSYMGSLLEEKLAIGTNSYIIKSKDINSLLKYFSKKFTVLNFDNYIMVIAPRRMQKSILNFVKSVDEKALIICEKVKFF